MAESSEDKKKQQPVILEGFMKKSGSSKKDEIKDNWKERYFVLKGTTLFYYKRKDDPEVKGKMELEDAKIDAADNKTGKLNSFRLKQGQPKEIYTYFVCNSSADLNQWLKAMRKAAGGYDIEGEEKKLAYQQMALCSYGVVLVISGAAERTLMHVDLRSQYIQFYLEEKLHEEHPCHNICTVVTGKTPDLSLKQPDGMVDLYSVKVELKDIEKKEKRMVTKDLKVYCGTLAEVKELEKLFTQLRVGDFSTPRLLTSKYPIVDRIKIRLGDMEEGHNWAPRWMCLGEKRILFFKKEESRVPVWALLLSMAKIDYFEKNKTILKISTGLESIVVRFDNAELCTNWYTNFMETKQKYNIITVEYTEASLEKEKPKKK